MFEKYDSLKKYRYSKYTKYKIKPLIMTQFFKKINYSACNEDSESERKALKINNSDIILCITASGARPLDLLIDNPKEIISVDFNETQNFLLLLKIEAYKKLSYSQFKSFIGLEEKFDRGELYKVLSRGLNPDAKIFWDTNKKLIKNGILYSGTWEKLLIGMSRLACTRKVMLNTLFSFDSVYDQKNYWNNHWNNKTWKIFLKLLSNKFLWQKIIREPGSLLLDKDYSIYKYISSKLNYLTNNFLLKNNHFASLVFYGSYKNTTKLPIHLREENFDILKSRITNITTITDSLDNVLLNKSITKDVTAFSLSDFGSYSTEKEYRNTRKTIITNAKAGAKFCERQFLLKRKPEKIFSEIKRTHKLETKLNQEDNTVFYTFCVGIINK